MTRFLFLMIAILMLPGAPVSAVGLQVDAITVARQKINLSGRQRMLSQRMAAQACVAQAAAEPAPHLQAAQSAHDEFARILKGLAEGDEGLKLTPETAPEILEALDIVETEWAIYSPAVRQIAARDTHTVVVQQLLSKNLVVLSTSNDAVQLFAKRYGEGVIKPSSAITINVAGRQRMLSQRMLKEACFIASGFAAQRHYEMLRKTTGLFLATLTDLENGNFTTGIMPPPTDEIRAQLAEVRALAEPLIAELMTFEPDDTTRLPELSELADRSTVLLRTMNAAVQMYVAQ